MTDIPEQSSLPRCACGHTREDVGKSVHVSASSEYSPWGWFLILFGITAKPSSVRFVCSQCRQIIEESTDPDVLKKYS